MMGNDLYRRPDDYYEQLAGKYRALTQAELDAALRAAVDPRGFTWWSSATPGGQPQLDRSESRRGRPSRGSYGCCELRASGVIPAPFSMR